MTSAIFLFSFRGEPDSETVIRKHYRLQYEEHQYYGEVESKECTGAPFRDQKSATDM